MVMLYQHTKGQGQGQRSLSSKDGVETHGRTDGQSQFRYLPLFIFQRVIQERIRGFI